MSDKKIYKGELIKEESLHDRLENLQIEAKIDLMNFLRDRMESVTARNELREVVLENLMARLQDKPEEISTHTLVNLLESLDSTENEKIKNILSVLKQQITVNNIADTGNNNNTIPRTLPEPKNEDMSREKFQEIKNTYDFMNRLKEAVRQQGNEENKE